MKTLIIYHKEDNDGIFSAAIIKHYLKARGKETEAFGADYTNLKTMTENDIADWKKKYEMVYMTDISFNDYTLMDKLYESYGSMNFVWIDHHAPVIEASKKNNHVFGKAAGYRSPDNSAIINAYMYFNIPKSGKYLDENAYEFPLLFKYLSAVDCWSWERQGLDFEYLRMINKGITIEYSLDFDKVFSLVEKIFEDDEWNDTTINKALNIGKPICEAEDNKNASLLENYGDGTWKVSGYPAIALFLQQGTSSTMFKSVKGKYDYGIVFKHQKTGEWVISLYILEDVPSKQSKYMHCGEYLKENYGGGGHAGAAGATISLEKFIEILRKKEI